jgi:hypothetical protein
MRFLPAFFRSRKGRVSLDSADVGLDDGRTPREIVLFFFITGLTGLAMGLSDNLFSNYFKDVYNVDAMTRGLIEFPRELPGLLCLVVISAGSFLGDIRMAMLAQITCLIGITALGLLTPSFSVMLIFLFINSLGMHTYVPLNESIGISLIKDGRFGSRMGQFNGIRTGATMIAGLMVFFGFKTGFFRFDTRIKTPFLLSAVIFIIVLGLFIALQRRIGPHPVKRRKLRLIFRKEYRYYYILSILQGAHKQIMIVFGPWVLIELLGKKADTLAILGVVGAGIGIFFMPMIGKWVDRFGPGRLMAIEGAAYISIYLVYGLLSAGFARGTLATLGWPVALMFSLFCLNRMAMQFGMVRVVYLQSIAIAPEEITPTISTGISMDHIVSITLAAAGGWAWEAIGPEFVFYFAAGLSVLNVLVANLVGKDKKGSAKVAA